MNTTNRFLSESHQECSVAEVVVEVPQEAAASCEGLAAVRTMTLTMATEVPRK